MNSIQNILSQLSETLSSQFEAANNRAEMAEHKYLQLCDGLRALVGEKSRSAPLQPANDSGPAELSPATHSGIPDQAFLDVVHSGWQSAHSIRKRLIASGLKVAFGTVYRRMGKLTSAFPDLLEAEVNPARWRLRLSETSVIDPLPKMPEATITYVRERLTCVPKPKRFHLPKLVQGNCFEVMAAMPEQSVDLILADPPYGTTKLPIDPNIDVSALWSAYRRVIKPTGTIILFGSQPFSSSLIAAAPDLFKHDLIWIKNHATGSLQARNRPLKQHEDILVFSSGTTIQKRRSKRRYTYNPLGQEAAGTKVIGSRKDWGYLHNVTDNPGRSYEASQNCPRTALYCSKERAGLHPFQKPLDLLEYLIRTYSNEGDLILDNFMGAGSTCIAALRSGRRSIGVELDPTHFKAASLRSTEAWQTVARNRSSMRVPTLADYEENALAA